MTVFNKRPILSNKSVLTIRRNAGRKLFQFKLLSGLLLRPEKGL